MVNMWLQASSLLAFLSTTVSGLNIPQARQVAITSSCTYWLDQITHQGVAAFNSNSSYVVYRNVQNYGAKGDGKTDDTAAINRAISDGARSNPASGVTSTNQAAVVYFPPGTYLISSSIIDYYYTQIIGNPNCLPTIKATAGFSGFGLIDGDPYGANGLSFGATNVFYRQIRNFIIDMTGIPPTSSATGIHWPTAQATSLQNIVFQMSQAAGTLHTGVFCESGSGGFMTDLIFNGGKYGMQLANQQFTMRNLTFNNLNTAINQLFNWGWTYKGLNVNNCSVAVDMTSGGSSAQNIASVIVIDSTWTNTPVGVLTAKTAGSLPLAAGSLILENVKLNNVPSAVLTTTGIVYLAGSTGSTTIAAWAQGNAYLPGPNQQFVRGAITPNPRPQALLGADGGFYQRSKPQYATTPLSSFVSVRSSGAAGNGIKDDTVAIQAAVNSAAAARKILFFDAGTYLVTTTIYFPTGSRIVGESYSVIMSSGSFFASITSPQPVVQVGKAGEAGIVEWSDMIVSTQGAQAGAILIEWNLSTPTSLGPSGMWDVHTRIGGFIGSNLQDLQCPTTGGANSLSPVRTQCIAAFMSMHVTPSATGLYMENNWLWTADHSIDQQYGGAQVSVFTGRGLYVESTNGILWLWGTAVEHHAKYQYQFANTKNIYMGQIQTETAYYQPVPNALIPFPTVAAYNDPVFTTANFSQNATVPNADGYGLRVLASSNLLVYGAGLYTFFNNYSTACSAQGGGEYCQSRIFDVESSTVYLYDLHTVGTYDMITRNGVDFARSTDNSAGFIDEIALFRS